MTILNENQEQMLVSVRTTYDDVLPVLMQMRDEYEYAVYLAKKPIRDVVEAAQEAGVPMARIVADGTDMQYAQKLKNWLQPTESVINRIMGGDAPISAVDTYSAVMESIETVTRNPSDGKFNVTYNGQEYTVPALGPDSEPWATEDAALPRGVYDLITERYPGFVVIGDEDED